MPRLCFALDLQDDAAAAAEYERLHRPGGVWPTVIEDIRARGFLSMQIWRTGARLFMIAEVADDFPRGQRSPETQAEVDRWEELVGTYQKLIPGAPEDAKWAPMRCIFDLDEHAPNHVPGDR